MKNGAWRFLRAAGTASGSASPRRIAAAHAPARAAAASSCRAAATRLHCAPADAPEHRETGPGPPARRNGNTSSAGEIAARGLRVAPHCAASRSAAAVRRSLPGGRLAPRLSAGSPPAHGSWTHRGQTLDDGRATRAMRRNAKQFTKIQLAITIAPLAQVGVEMGRRTISKGWRRRACGFSSEQARGANTKSRLSPGWQGCSRYGSLAHPDCMGMPTW